MVRIAVVEIEDHILDKIETKHGVQWEEVEEVCYATTRHVRRGREGLYQVFGQTDSGRYLFIVLADRGGGTWKVATAREMTDGERDLYKDQRGVR